MTLDFYCALQAAEHTFNVDTAVNDFEGLGDATQNFKRNKDLFLKESLHILQSAVPEGLFGREISQFCSMIVIF